MPNLFTDRTSKKLVQLIQKLYQTKGQIGLHEPLFIGQEKRYLSDAIDSTFVSTSGKNVEEFEDEVKKFTGAKHAIATVNGTAALHLGLKSVGVSEGSEVVTQAFTFVATANSISYTGANPVFVDIDRDSLGLSAASLERFLLERCDVNDQEECINKKTRKRVSACVPMHCFGNPCDSEKISQLCSRYNIPLIEDAAEALGSFAKKRHVGTEHCSLAILSFNGNKIITTGGGGMILTNDEKIARYCRHLSTTAKVAHPWAFEHDQVGFNYRMPNINAALGLAQLEMLPKFLVAKRRLAKCYIEWSRKEGLEVITEADGNRSNYWLNAIVMPDRESRDRLLSLTNNHNIMTRPAWIPMNHLSIYAACEIVDLEISDMMADRVVCLPSGVPKSWI